MIIRRKRFQRDYTEAFTQYPPLNKKERSRVAPHVLEEIERIGYELASAEIEAGMHYLGRKPQASSDGQKMWAMWTSNAIATASALDARYLQMVRLARMIGISEAALTEADRRAKERAQSKGGGIIFHN